jgi:hypothetical protein
MKKLLIPLLLLTGCHQGMTKIHYSKNVGKCIENLEHLEEWLQRDYDEGKIPIEIANNYAIVIVNTKYGLIKKQKKLKKYIQNEDEY